MNFFFFSKVASIKQRKGEDINVNKKKKKKKKKKKECSYKNKLRTLNQKLKEQSRLIRKLKFHNHVQMASIGPFSGIGVNPFLYYPEMATNMDSSLINGNKAHMKSEDPSATHSNSVHHRNWQIDTSFLHDHLDQDPNDTDHSYKTQFQKERKKRKEKEQIIAQLQSQLTQQTQVITSFFFFFFFFLKKKKNGKAIIRNVQIEKMQIEQKQMATHMLPQYSNVIEENQAWQQSYQQLQAKLDKLREQVHAFIEKYPQFEEDLSVSDSQTRSHLQSQSQPQLQLHSLSIGRVVNTPALATPHHVSGLTEFAQTTAASSGVITDKPTSIEECWNVIDHLKSEIKKFKKNDKKDLNDIIMSLLQESQVKLQDEAQRLQDSSQSIKRTIDELQHAIVECKNIRTLVPLSKSSESGSNEMNSKTHTKPLIRSLFKWGKSKSSSKSMDHDETEEKKTDPILLV
ncbi:hypothetical protein RFI_28116 [Reticulomyxa filosa]|uniref:Uncharacterized protein n=1 Tax=Reticulomyxa filosa TaxID=46433 RepID=X6M5R5_RETFI|nr:hypothetical protein RFI_28116 [Reticulomyxa filosa]|eukprot:ETO09269.1 hypothetical protein RFI_28116 [Reticulomyxa filosa]